MWQEPSEENEIGSIKFLLNVMGTEGTFKNLFPLVGGQVDSPSHFFTAGGVVQLSRVRIV